VGHEVVDLETLPENLATETAKVLTSGVPIGRRSEGDGRIKPTTGIVAADK